MVAFAGAALRVEDAKAGLLGKGKAESRAAAPTPARKSRRLVGLTGDVVSAMRSSSDAEKGLLSNIPQVACCLRSRSTNFTS